MINTEQLIGEFYLITIIAKVKLAEKINDLFHTKGTSGATTFLATCYGEDDRKRIMAMQGQRKEVVIKAAHRDQLNTIINHVEDRYPYKEKGENFLFINRLSGLVGLEGYGDVNENPSFKDSPLPKDSSFKMVTIICNHGEGEDYIDATQRQDILQHILIKGHGSAKISQNYEGRYFQPEKDIVMQILSSKDIHELREFTKAYEAIQFNVAGAIAFSRDIFYFHRF